MSGYQVRLARRDDLGELGDVLGRAFHDDPVMGHVISKRPLAPRAALMLRLISAMHLDDESVYVAVDDATGAILGGSVWAPPDRWKTDVRAYLPHLGTLLRAVGLRGVGNIRVLEAMEKQHPRELHHYLAVLGTDPEHQGRGVGSALMQPVLDRCETEGLPAYLESSKESNIAFYRRHRFEVTGTHTIPKGPTIYFMWRPAPD